MTTPSGKFSGRSLRRATVTRLIRKCRARTPWRIGSVRAPAPTWLNTTGGLRVPISSSPTNPASVASVANAAFMVSPAARGLGIGRRMGEHCLAEARRAGFRGSAGIWRTPDRREPTRTQWKARSQAANHGYSHLSGMDKMSNASKLRHRELRPDRRESGGRGWVGSPSSQRATS